MAYSLLSTDNGNKEEPSLILNYCNNLVAKRCAQDNFKVELSYLTKVNWVFNPSPLCFDVLPPSDMNEIATPIFLFQTLDQMMTGTVKVTSDAVLAVVLYTKGIQEKALKSLFSRQLIIAHTCISGKYYQKILKKYLQSPAF